MQADASGVNGNPSAPSVTTSGGSRLVLAFYANKKPTTYSGYTSPAVERFDIPNVPGGLPSNALASYTQAAAGATGAKSATPGEAAEWVAQQIAIAPAAGASATKFSWDVNHPLPELALERDAAGSLLRRYLYGNDLYSLQTPAGSFYYHPDGLGSISNVTDAAGVKQWSYSWEPFGTPRTQTQDAGSAPANPMRFTGEYEDATGLYHLRARQFDPTAGRFLSYDPWTPPRVLPWRSEYLYVGNRPTVFTDPSGLCEWYEWPCDPLSMAIGDVLEDAANVAAGVNDAGNDIVRDTRESIWDFYTDPSVADGILNSTADWLENCSAVECAQDTFHFLAADLAVCRDAEASGDVRATSRFCLKALAGFFLRPLRALSAARRSLPVHGSPNSTDVIDRGGGRGQIRDYGPDGRAKTDFDFGHDHGAGDPHGHDWDWTKDPPRQPGRPIRDDE